MIRIAAKSAMNVETAIWDQYKCDLPFAEEGSGDVNETVFIKDEALFTCNVCVSIQQRNLNTRACVNCLHLVVK